MTQVVTVSATTAAYAAEAVKPSARVRGDGPADEAITLLAPRRLDGIATGPVAPTPVARMKGALSQALMLISAERRPPQESAVETLRRYLEFMQEEESGNPQEEPQEEPRDDPADDEKTDAGDEQDSDEVAAMLDEFLQRA